MIFILKMTAAIDSNVISYTCILVDDCVVNVAIITNAQLWNSFILIFSQVFHGFVIITSHQVGAVNFGSITNPCPDAHNTMLKPFCMNNASVGSNRIQQRSATKFGRWQHPWTSVNFLFVMKKIERW